MAFELCNNLSKFHLSEENSGLNCVYIHFLEKNSERFCLETSIHDIFPYVANLDKLLHHQDFSLKNDMETIYEDFNKFSGELEQLVPKLSINQKEIEIILENKLEYFSMLLSLSELGVPKDEFNLYFSDLELCKVERDENLEFDDVTAILYDIFPDLSKESGEIKIVFHDLEGFSSHFFVLLELIEKVGIDVVFSFSENVGFKDSEFIEKLSPFGLLLDESSCDPAAKCTISKKYQQEDPYFLHKDRWLVLFFHSLFRMWDDESKKIKLRSAHLMNLFQGWWFPEESGRKLINIFLKLEILLDKEMEIDAYITRLEIMWQKHSLIKEENSQSPLHMVSIYGAVSSDEYYFFIESIKKIKELSDLLCFRGTNVVGFLRALDNLSLFYQKKQKYFIEFEERKALNYLDTQLNKLMPEISPPSLVFTLFREKIKFSLQDNEVVLSSLSSENRDYYDVYSGGNSIVWESMSAKWKNSNKYVQVFANIMLDKKKKLYFPHKEIDFAKSYIEKKRVMQITYERSKGMSFFLCPYRYFSSFILNNGAIIRDKTLYLKFYENILVMEVWKSVSESGSRNFYALLVETDQIYHTFFPFLTWKNRYDAIIRAKNYLLHSIMKDGSPIRGFAESHMNMKFQYGEAFFQGVGSPKPLPVFSDFVKKGYHSLHQIPKASDKKVIMPLRQQMTDYVNNDVSYYSRGDWCMYCTEQRNCQNSR